MPSLEKQRSARTLRQSAQRTQSACHVLSSTVSRNLSRIGRSQPAHVMIIFSCCLVFCFTAYHCLSFFVLFFLASYRSSSLVVLKVSSFVFFLRLFVESCSDQHMLEQHTLYRRSLLFFTSFHDGHKFHAQTHAQKRRSRFHLRLRNKNDYFVRRWRLLNF